MKIPQSPETQILEAMKRIAQDAHMGKTLGFEKEFTVRHYRNRKAVFDERPCLGLRILTSDSNDEELQAYHTASETCWKMEVSLVIDIDLPPEDEDAVDTSARTDLTGWDHLTTIARLFTNLFINTDGPMIGYVVDDVRPGRMDPDEESKPDQGRLACSLIVLYRTSATDMMRLLNAEMNA